MGYHIKRMAIYQDEMDDSMCHCCRGTPLQPLQRENEFATTCSSVAILSRLPRFKRDDEVRQGNLEGVDLSLLRFHDREVKHDMANVLRLIQNWIEEQGKKMLQEE
jgi:hypothetical protein